MVSWHDPCIRRKAKRILLPPAGPHRGGLGVSPRAVLSRAGLLAPCRSAWIPSGAGRFPTLVVAGGGIADPEAVAPISTNRVVIGASVASRVSSAGDVDCSRGIRLLRFQGRTSRPRWDAAAQPFSRRPSMRARRCSMFFLQTETNATRSLSWSRSSPSSAVIRSQMWMSAGSGVGSCAVP